MRNEDENKSKYLMIKHPQILAIPFNRFSLFYTIQYLKYAECLSHQLTLTNKYSSHVIFPDKQYFQWKYIYYCLIIVEQSHQTSKWNLNSILYSIFILIAFMLGYLFAHWSIL
jgi:hypothetical protein